MLSEKCMRRLIRSKAPVKKLYDDLALIDTYLKHLFEFIEQDYSTRQGILRKLNTPIGPNNTEKLLMCVSIILDQELENLGGFEYEPILDIKLYINLEERLRDTLYKA